MKNPREPFKNGAAAAARVMREMGMKLKLGFQPFGDLELCAAVPEGAPEGMFVGGFTEPNWNGVGL